MSESEKVEILSRVLGRFFRSGKEHLFQCPKCDHHKNKFSVNFVKNKFKCWVCDYAGHSIRRIIRRYGTFVDLSEWDRLEGTLDLNAFDNLFGTTDDAPEPETVHLPEEFVSLTRKKLPLASKPARKYLAERGINQSDIIRWKIGYCPSGDYGERIIVPSFNLRGDLNYFVGRSYSDHWQKYDQPAVSRDIVFNHLYVDWDDDIIIVEGVFDAIVAGKNAIPILGSTLKEYSRLFQEIVAHDSVVYIALDPDAERKALKLVKQLLDYDIELYKVDISPYGDVGDMFPTEFQKRKQQAQQMSQEKYLLYCAKHGIS